MYETSYEKDKILCNIYITSPSQIFVPFIGCNEKDPARPNSTTAYCVRTDTLMS